MLGSEVPGSEPAHLRRRRKRSRATGEARGLASKQIHSWFCMVLANLLLFANFVTIKYLLYCGSRRNRLAGTEPIPVRFRNTGWGTLRRPFALVSIENVVIVTESCEMTVGRDSQRGGRTPPLPPSRLPPPRACFRPRASRTRRCLNRAPLGQHRPVQPWGAI